MAAVLPAAHAERAAGIGPPQQPGLSRRWRLCRGVSQTTALGGVRTRNRCMEESRRHLQEVGPLENVEKTPTRLVQLPALLRRHQQRRGLDFRHQAILRHSRPQR
jgi:hypothetical protein